MVEGLRDDHANHILGMRVNSWVSILVFLGGLALFWHQRRKPRSQNYPAEPDQDRSEPAEPAASRSGGSAGDR